MPASEVIKAWQAQHAIFDVSTLAVALDALFAHCSMYWADDHLAPSLLESRMTLFEEKIVLVIFETVLSRVTLLNKLQVCGQYSRCTHVFLIHFNPQNWDVFKLLMHLHIRIINEQTSATMHELELSW